MMNIERIRHQWSEKAGFVLLRPDGAREYVLLHFHTPVEMSYADARYSVAPGTVIVFSPRVPHRVDCPDMLLHDWIHITGDVCDEMRRYGLSPDTLYPGMDIQEISELIAFLEMEFFARRSYWQDLSNARLRELFIRISHGVSDKNGAARIHTETIERLREARAHMLRHPEWEWTISKLSQEVGLSPSRLHTLYKNSFGVSPNRDLILIRAEKSKFLLYQGKSVSETAEALGFNSTYHFIRQFKQVTGTTPGRYRDMNAPSEDGR